MPLQTKSKIQNHSLWQEEFPIDRILGLERNQALGSGLGIFSTQYSGQAQTYLMRATWLIHQLGNEIRGVLGHGDLVGKGVYYEAQAIHPCLKSQRELLPRQPCDDMTLTTCHLQEGQQFTLSRETAITWDTLLYRRPPAYFQ